MKGFIMTQTWNRDIIHLLQQKSRYIKKCLDTGLIDHQLYSAQWSILYCLEQFGSMTQTEIKDYLLVEAPTITRTIEKLEKNGWITRTPGKDKRARIISISEAGKTDLKPIIEQVGNIEATLLQHFSTEEKATLYHLLQKINQWERKKNMQQAASTEKIWTKSFISLSITQFLLFTIFYALLTTLPIYVISNLGESESSGGLVVTFMLASAILVRPFSAKVLDILGKKTGLVLSILLFTATTFFYLWMDSFTPLLILRFIHGISFSILTTATSAIAADIIPKERRGAGMGYFAMAMNLAVVAGPFIGLTLLQFISFQQFFFVLSLLMSISVVFSLFVQTGEKQTADTKQDLSLRLHDLIEPKAIPIALISGL